jgi:hypothetical protein CLOSPO_01966
MNRIKSLRLKNKLTQTELAKYMNVAQNTISYWEQGKYDIDNESLKKLADLFDCSTDYLLGRETKNPVIKNDNGNGKNIVTMIGRDGRQEKRILTDEQFKAWLAMMEQMPDADNL